MNRIVLLLLFSLILIVGCSTQDTVVKKYYVLETQEAKKSLDSVSTFLSGEFCKVEKVNIYPAFAKRQIANRSDSHKITYYSSHEWAVRPAEVFTYMLVDYMDRQGLFKNVAERFWKVSPKYIIKTKIYQLEVVKEDDELAAHLNVEFKLLNNNTQELVAKHKADRTQTLEEKKINIFASNISDMFHAELDKFSYSIHQTFKESK